MIKRKSEKKISGSIQRKSDSDPEWDLIYRAPTTGEQPQDKPTKGVKVDGQRTSKVISKSGDVVLKKDSVSPHESEESDGGKSKSKGKTGNLLVFPFILLTS